LATVAIHDAESPQKMIVMDILLLTGDLATSSAVSGAAARCGAACATSWSLANIVEKAESGTPRLVILDLSTSGLDPTIVLPKLKELATPPERIVAFGPHVHEAKLAAARAAGCDEVVSRGRFHADIDAIVGWAIRD
jgi:CheY-like chemotaxis protein